MVSKICIIQTKKKMVIENKPTNIHKHGSSKAWWKRDSNLITQLRHVLFSTGKTVATAPYINPHETH